VSPPAHPARIAVIQTAFLGDVVFTAPLVRALKARFGTAKLTMVVAPRGEAIARHMPGVDEVAVLDKRGAHRSLLATWRFGRALKANLVVVPHPSTRSALLARAIPRAFRVGPASLPQRLAYDLPVHLDAPRFVSRMLALATALGAEATPDLELRISIEERAQARTLLGAGRFAAVMVGSEWATKRFPAKRWAELLDALVGRGLTPVMLGAPNELPLAEAVLAASARPDAYRSFVGNSVAESLALLSVCSVAVGGDTGLLHAARALSVPSVALFGPTDPAAHLWEAATEVVRLTLPCQPCHPHGPSRCPLGHHACMQALPPEMVLTAVERRLR